MFYANSVHFGLTLNRCSIIPVIIGSYFKTMHWPGASILLLLGAFIMALLYLPSWVMLSWPTGTTKRIVIVLQAFVLWMFATGFLFKLQHWPGAGIFFYANYFTLFFVVTPYTLYHIYKSGKKSIASVNNLFLAVYFFSFCNTSLLQSNSGKISIKSVELQGLRTEKAYKAAVSRNSQLYNILGAISSTAGQNVPELQKGLRLKKMVDDAIKNIGNIKSALLLIDSIPKSVADTISCVDIISKNNIDIPTRILIGDNEYSLSKDENSAYRLKLTLNTLKDSMLSFVQQQNRTVISEGLNLNTNNAIDEGELVSWEVFTFYQMPLLYDFNTLTDLQYEIKNAEYQVLSDILNTSNSESNPMLFNKAAYLNSKFEQMKKQEEIKKLQTEKDQGIEMLNQKASELDNTQNTIAYFVLIMIAFTVLIFFVIRNAYLRKKANQVLAKQKHEIEMQKEFIEEKQLEIVDSITYAKRLQQAILPSLSAVKEHLPNSFVYYQPKDIVAGDFYWMHTTKELTFIAAADCTGHGVPGAMVSVVCSNALNRAVNEFNLTDTRLILDKTRELVIETFEKSDAEVKDGMDISLLRIKKQESGNRTEVQWSGANNSLWYILNNELLEIKADKQPIGKYSEAKPFTTNNFTFNEPVTFYLFSDGYADQFSPDDKKLMKKKFKDIMLSNQNLSMQEQGKQLEKMHIDWKGTMEQTDDVLVIGIKI